MSWLEVRKISTPSKDGFALHEVSFSIDRFQRLGMAGETGSGKSTLLRIMSGLVQPSSGEVLLDGERVLGPDEKLVAGHPSIAYLSQQSELPKFLRVEQVLDYASTLSVKDAEEIYTLCDVGHLLKRRTDQLSGGEQQRIALARLLIGSPRLLLLDEPFSHLDGDHKRTLKKVIRDISQSLGITCVLVSHDPLDTLPWADHLVVLKEGRIVQSGTPSEVYRKPVDVYCANLFGKCNVLNASDGRLLLRPEEMFLDGRRDNGWPGKVRGVFFYGGYWEAEVDTDRGTLVIRLDRPDVMPGQEVNVSWSGGHSVN